MLTNEQIKKLEIAREGGAKIGLVQGSWDLFHVGHLKYLTKAMRRCDFLIIGVDSDAKIQKRKGPGRPIIPENERCELLTLLRIADDIVLKGPDEPKWGLIKAIRPDVLIAIAENYKDEDITKLKEFCGEVLILPRQSEKSTSDAVRKMQISGRKELTEMIALKVPKVVEEIKIRTGFEEGISEPLSKLFQHLNEATDWIMPVSAGCFLNGQWYFGTNKIDINLSMYDIVERTELFYATVEHAEMNLLKKLGNVPVIDTPIWTTLFPCDKCMKVLIDKGVKEIYYLEDHPEKNWSKRSHELAEKKDIKTMRIISGLDIIEEVKPSEPIADPSYKFIDPRNIRDETQLDIMLRLESNNQDPLDPEVIEQEILFMSDYWYVSRNRFPYKEIRHQFLIISRYSIYKIEDMSEGMWLELSKIWERLVLDYDIPGGALCYRFGNTTYSGASLTRLHVHLIQPLKSNKTKFTIGGNEKQKSLSLE